MTFYIHADDEVYMSRERDLGEYVMNEDGQLFFGSSNNIGVSPWNFGQVSFAGVYALKSSSSPKWFLTLDSLTIYLTYVYLLAISFNWHLGIYHGCEFGIEKSFLRISNACRVMTHNDSESSPTDKSAYWKIIFLISRPKHMLWVLKRTVSMRGFF